MLLKHFYYPLIFIFETYYTSLYYLQKNILSYNIFFFYHILLLLIIYYFIIIIIIFLYIIAYKFNVNIELHLPKTKPTLTYSVTDFF